MKGPRTRPIPQRTCIACRTTGPKRGLVRVVRTVAGTVEIDPTGKKSGRGAYLCNTRGCWDKALNTKILEQALKIAINKEDRAALQAYGAALPVGDDPEESHAVQPAARTGGS